MHCVVHASRIEISGCYERSNFDTVDQTSLKDIRQVEPSNVVTNNLIDLRIKSAHQGQEIGERLLFGLFLAVRVNSKDVLAVGLNDSFYFFPDNRANVHCDRKNPT